MQTRTLGQHQVGAIGLGLMTFDQTGTQPRQQLLDTVSAALDAGVTLFDTADAYGPGDEKGAGAQGENERLIASILDELGVRDRVAARHQGRPRPHRRRRLGHRQLGRPPPRGRRRQPAAPRRRADRAVAAPPARTRRSPTTRSSARSRRSPTAARSPTSASPTPTRSRSATRTPSSATRSSACRTSSAPSSAPAGPRSTCARSSAWRSCRGARWAASPTPRSSPTSTPPSPRSPQERGVSAQQVALAWELAQSPVVIPIPGAKRPTSITDSAAAADIELTADELARLDAS